MADAIIAQVRQLPEPAALAVLRFARSLGDPDSSDLRAAQLGSLAAVWDNPEDAVWDDA